MTSATTTLYFPPTSEAWLVRARQAAGYPGFVVGLVVWRAHKMAWSQPAKLTHDRMRRVYPMDRKTFSSALTRLSEAGLIELERAPGRAARVTVIPIPGEEELTARWLKRMGQG